MSYKKLHTRVVPDQSAAIPYRIHDAHIEVLLITTRNKGKWIVPKGRIEDDLESHMSAKREALEEAGVKGRVSPVSLGCYRHGTESDAPIVEVFLMRVEDELSSWMEQDERTRRWVPLAEAYHHVEEQGLKSILDEATLLMRQTLSASTVNGTRHPAIPRPRK
jgi:8-oxo-dGTP pyrophosphatase MutT (NUDIX family)